MNKGQNVRRGRTRHTPNKNSGSLNNGTGNRVDSKSRGNPQQNLDKYLGMARDALQAGDRINEEYYLQFAEHFQRVINDRAQEEDNRKDRSRNNNNNNNNNNPRPRHQSQAAAQEKVSANTVVDPANVDQPKIIEVKEGKAEPVNKEPVSRDAVPAETKAKPRVVRKREPRVKKADVPAENSSNDAAVMAAPEISPNSDNKAAE